MVSAHWPFAFSHRPRSFPHPHPQAFALTAPSAWHTFYPVLPWLASAIAQRSVARTHSPHCTPPSLSFFPLLSFTGTPAPWHLTKSWCLSYPEWHSQNQAQGSGGANSKAGTFMRSDCGSPCLSALGPHKSPTCVRTQSSVICPGWIRIEMHQIPKLLP